MPTYQDSAGNVIDDDLSEEELLAEGAKEGPPTDEERWEHGADPGAFIARRGMGRWLYVSQYFSQQRAKPAVDGLSALYQ